MTEKENKELKTFLITIKRVFMHYGYLHEQKGPRGADKAKANYTLARRVSKAIDKFCS